MSESVDASDVHLRGIFERDIDLLLLEELISSPGFRACFLERIGEEPWCSIVSAGRSVLTATGESDLELTLADGNEHVRILIENKVDAPLQPNQDLRYVQRAEACIESEECDRVLTVLISPEDYLGHDLAFDKHLTYEEVQSWLDESGLGVSRLQFKRRLLEQAIERKQSTWTLVPDESATSFWKAYWRRAQDGAPRLAMPEPGPKASGSRFIRFWPATLDSGLQLYHKVPYGHVDLLFPGQAQQLVQFNESHGHTLSRRMDFVRAGKSLVLRVEVPPIPTFDTDVSTSAAVGEALESALELLDWYEEHLGSGRRPA